ncbi:IucA/IucC family protein [Streptomyces sp. SID3343]|uniref:IucA/IucC family protein n=1 Tax=Streptomyces sp. SID3343 TaxID=2690260 RepID=UPI0013686A41|nr:IucA/IucC family protein [Streptomyces sp. SID3343]MYW05856.1 siderophore biosynthesis protein [Streptomyces sp. SID3343]
MTIAGFDPSAVWTDPEADHLDAPDARYAADGATVECLLRCWVRERAVARPKTDTLTIALPATGLSLSVPVRYWSTAGWHRFGLPHLVGEGPLNAVRLALVLGDEASAASAAAAAAVGPGAAEAGGGAPGDACGDTAIRVADSVTHTERYIAYRREQPEDSPGTTPFLAAEQSLVLGHPMHPTPKSRDRIDPVEDAAWSPELRGAFALHWFAADADLVAQDSALGREAADVLADFAGDLRAPAGTVLVPAHPWQARDLPRRPHLRALLDAGRLRALGPAGAPWHPTSSVRTVYRPDADVMLKLSLGLRITNSRRENLPKELLRGIEVHRLLRSGLERELRSVHPTFDIVRDPAWISVAPPEPYPRADRPAAGMELMLRANAFGPGDSVSCVAALVAERPGIGPSRLAASVYDLATRTGRTHASVAQEWFERYLALVAEPVLWLDRHAGVALEAHHQNTLVLLDGDGLPIGGRFRDNQGYYFRASRSADLARRLPAAGIASDTIVADEIADERLAYYLGFNNLLGLIGAFGAQRLVDERVLLARTRAALAPWAEEPGAARTLLTDPRPRCKANLMTRLHGLDELVGPVATQSVYVHIRNPLADVPA